MTAQPMQLMTSAVCLATCWGLRWLEPLAPLAPFALLGIAALGQLAVQATLHRWERDRG